MTGLVGAVTTPSCIFSPRELEAAHADQRYHFSSAPKPTVGNPVADLARLSPRIAQGHGGLCGKAGPSNLTGPLAFLNPSTLLRRRHRRLAQLRERDL